MGQWPERTHLFVSTRPESRYKKRKTLQELEAEVLSFPSGEILGLQEILGPVVAGLDGTSVDLAEALPLAVVAIGTLQDQIVRICPSVFSS